MTKARDFSVFPLTYSAEMEYPYPWNKPDKENYYKAGITYEKPLTPEQRAQAQAILSKLRTLPRFLSSRFERIYNNKTRIEGLNKGQAYLYFDFHQNLWPRLFATQARYQVPFGQCESNIPVFDLTPDIEQLNHLPDLSSRALKRLAKNIAQGFFTLYEQRCDALQVHHDGDKKVIFDAYHQSMIYGEIADLSRLLHVTPLHFQTYDKYGVIKLKQVYSAIARLVSPDFWERRLKEKRTRWIESLSIAAMDVNCNSTPYVSKRGVKAVISQKLNNIQYLKTMDVEDEDTGARSDLYDKVEKSISNPVNRYNELMTMTRGIENVACERGDIGLFLTLTCPSKYHATSKVRKGKKHKDKKLNKYKALPNNKWVVTEKGEPPTGALTVKESQQYLTHVWALIRTALGDKNIDFYGIRTVEPHHDSTPHWHILFFTSPEHRATVIDIFKQKALAEDGDETGAQEHRFKCENMIKGKATGYIAKYIAKCIPGQHKGAEAMKADLDIETGHKVQPDNKEEVSAPDRIAAWASIWRIRQFQSFGIPSKGVYRECRRLRGINKNSIEKELGNIAEKVRAAADQGKFDEYITAQGGPCIPAHEQTLRVAREIVDKPNDYGEFRKKTVGLYTPLDSSRQVLNTYPKKYRIVPKKPVTTDSAELGVMPLERAIGAPRSTVNNCRSDLWTCEEIPPISELESTAKAIKHPLKPDDLTFTENSAQHDQESLTTPINDRRISALELTENEQLLRADIRQFFESKAFEIPHNTFIDMFIKGMRISDEGFTYWYDGARIRERLNARGQEQLKEEIDTQKQIKKQNCEERIAAVLARVKKSKKESTK